MTQMGVVCRNLSDKRGFRAASFWHLATAWTGSWQDDARNERRARHSGRANRVRGKRRIPAFDRTKGLFGQQLGVIALAATGR